MSGLKETAKFILEPGTMSRPIWEDVKALARAYLASEALAGAVKVVISGHITDDRTSGDMKELYDALEAYEKEKG
jgi:hypothetical protein